MKTESESKDDLQKVQIIEGKQQGEKSTVQKGIIALEYNKQRNEQ